VSQKGEGGGDGQNGRCHQMSSYIYIYIRIIRMWCFGQPKFGINPIKTSTGGSQKNWRLQAKLTI
jgi:hypothetical protein